MAIVTVDSIDALGFAYAACSMCSWGFTDFNGGAHVRQGLGVAVSAALMLGLLVGCSGKSGDEASPGGASATSKAQSGPSWQDEIKPAASAGKLGASGTPCALPVSFDLAQSWKAKPVADSGAGAALAQQGGFTLRCEVDAKPAGHIGFLRVWAGGKAGDDPRKALDNFLTSEKNVVDPQYRDPKVGSLVAAEVTYLKDNPALGERKRERALAVVTPRGVVLLALGGLDSQEHEQMLPAYLLAKQSIAVTS